METSVAPVMIENGRRREATTTSEVLLRRKKPSKGGWNAAIFIVFMELAERFSIMGLSGNLIVYLSTVLKEPTATAAKNVNTWTGVSSLFPLLGAFVADSYLGRFTTILISSVIFFLGMVLLSLAVTPVIPLSHRKAIFFTALYILAIGEGGHRPCVQTFAADQFDESTPQQKQIKSSFFNWWYLAIVVGSSVAVFLVVYIQDRVGWAVGYGLLAGTLAFALALFLMGIKRYRKESAVGSPFTTVFRVFVAAARKWRLNEKAAGYSIYYEDDNIELPNKSDRPRIQSYSRTNQLRCLDKAMIIDKIDSSNRTRNPWRLCTLNQVEEVKLVVRLIPICLSCLMFSAVLAQIHTFFTKQAMNMVRTIGHDFEIPPPSLQAIIGITILIFVPTYDQVLVPFARRFTGIHSGITILQRIGVGLFLSMVNMVVAGIVEYKRVGVARQLALMDSPSVPMSIWWLLPQYMISGVADVFTVVGLQELCYDQMPEEMRSFGAAVFLSVLGVGSFINSAIITIVQAITSDNWLGDNLNRAHLDRFYWVLAGLSGLNLCVYVWIAKRFEYKKVVDHRDEADELEF